MTPTCACPCGRPLPQAAVDALDPFATRACAAAHYGTEAYSAVTSQRPGGTQRPGGSYVQLGGPLVPFNALTEGRALADRQARERL